MNEQSATSRYVLDIAVGGKLIWIGIKIKTKLLTKATK